ncbi:penicillin-binding protein activator LpoB [Labilibaculum sp. DW002]|uniref:Penicillin-binding protein activator LpoB n=1 Tax=Paralabilibaculum antarcticum TaxID=2912572 RepID=A0ABT5VN69_9BACT|nr:MULTISPECIES: penicillin-binding protein activator LpoB [unclassified Labilibaculum]MBI9059323.1 penicillin-binding protein activator LpoB [Labilibaculum sp.]MDE5416884.1 penicillin-binding protein activator LpoB [Labilibaculum sp. DW002]
MKYSFRLIVFTLAIFASVSCSRQVTRVSPDQQIDLSGRWNDTDSKLTAEALIEQLLTRNWIENYQQETGKKPVVIVGLITNKSSEHIDSDTYIKDIEKAILNDGRVRLVQAGAKREALREERADQQDFASKASIKKWGQELGADFILQGDISSIIDSYKKEKVRYYQLNLELTNLETSELVWMGDKKIKKYVNK